MSERAKQVINELKVEKKILLKENIKLKKRIEVLQNWVAVEGKSATVKELDRARKENRMLYVCLLLLCLMVFVIFVLNI